MFAKLLNIKLKYYIHISIQTIYSVLCWKAFGSDNIIDSSWIWRYKLGTPLFGEFLPFFSVDPLKLSGWIGSIASQLFSGLSRDVVSPDRCVPFQIISNLLNLPQMDSSWRNISRMIHGNRMHLSSISSPRAKGLNSYGNNVFLVLFLIHLQKKKMFSLCHYGVFLYKKIYFRIRLWRNKM